MMRVSGKNLVFIFLLVLGMFSGCQESFQPLQENDKYYFSMYGYLDAAADTQWVRISPSRDQLNMLPVTPEMKVTLKHLQTGNTMEMHDSLFTQENGANFLNFWTSEDLEPGSSYKLKAKRPDGATSQVSISLPQAFPTPRLRREQNFFGEPDTYTLFVEGIEHLAEVQIKWYVRLIAPGFDKKRVFSFSYRNEAVKRYNGSYRVHIEPAKDREKISRQTTLPPEGEIRVLHRQVFIAAGGPEWDEDISSIDDLVYALPDGFSNVKDGLGYMVGINSKWIPFKSCYTDNSLLIACPEEEPYW